MIHWYIGLILACVTFMLGWRIHDWIEEDNES